MDSLLSCNLLEPKTYLVLYVPRGGPGSQAQDEGEGEGEREDEEEAPHLAAGVVRQVRSLYFILSLLLAMISRSQQYKGKSKDVKVL